MFSSVPTCLTLDLSEPAKRQKTHGGRGHKDRKGSFYDDIAILFSKNSFREDKVDSSLTL